MQVYRGLPILTNQSGRHAPRRRSATSTTRRSVGEYQRLAHAAIDEILARRPNADRRRRDRPLPARRARGARAAAAVRRRARASGSSGSTTRTAPSGPTSCWRSATRLRRRPCTRTTAAASCARSSSPRPASSLRPGRDRLWSGETRHPTLIVGLDAPPRGAPAADRGAHPGDVRARGGGGGPPGRSPGPSPQPRATSTACARSPSSRARRRSRRSSSRTRRYAVYQRKWMRRIPGLVPVDGDRPTGEVADEIVAQLGSVAGP